MRVFICLSIFSFVLAACQENCSSYPPLRRGKVVKPNTCLDPYDGKPHPIGAAWSTAECFVCECSRAGMRCCQRARRTVLVPRCKEGENPESCHNGPPGLDEKCQFIIPVDAFLLHYKQEIEY